jgi:hypothetical protein
MTTATYKTMPALLATLTPFKHGSHSARWNGEVYQVYSYSTIIATAVDVNRGFVDVTTFNQRKYSVTTSRLQNIIRKAWSI